MADTTPSETLTKIRAQLQAAIQLIDATLQPTPAQGTRMYAQADGVRIRATPSISAPVIGQLKTNDLLFVVDDITADLHPWVKITDGQYIGYYVAKDLLATSPKS